MQYSERIAFFCQPYEGVSSRSERLGAFRSVLSKDGHPSVDDVFVVDLRSDNDLGEKLDFFLQSSKGQTRALFAANGVVMLKLILELQIRELEIPKDIALAG